MGSTAVSDKIGGGWKTVNFDMSTLYMTDPDNWFDPDQKYQNRPAWHHSDIKDVPYVHIYKLFNEISGRNK